MKQRFKLLLLRFMMDKEILKKYINDKMTVAFLATIDNENASPRPRVRPVNIRYQYDKLLLPAHKKTNKVKQISDNNKVEISWMFSNFSHVRMEADIVTVEDSEIVYKYLKENPNYGEYFNNGNKNDFILYEIMPDKVLYNNWGETKYRNICW